MIELPVACSLAPAELADRRAAWAALAEGALARPVPIDDGVRLVFAGGPAVEARLRELVALERDCCGFMRFELRADDGGIVLEVAAPPGPGVAAVRELFAVDERLPRHAAAGAGARPAMGLVRPAPLGASRA